MYKNYLGCFYGMIIGDLLGSSYQYKNKYNLDNLLKKNTINGILHINLDDNLHNIDLALIVTHFLISEKKFNISKISKNYLEWFSKINIDDISVVIEKSFLNASNFIDIYENNKEYNKLLTNDVLIRIPPYALFSKSEELYNICKDECNLTNPNDISIELSYIYLLSIQNSFIGMSKQLIVDYAILKSTSKNILKMLEDSKKTPIYITNKTNHIFISIQFAFYELLNGESFYKSMINVIRHVGETSTNGIIIGALLGSYYGSDKIPKEWLKMIDKEYGLEYIENMVSELVLI